jgi:hypothetical protein
MFIFNEFHEVITCNKKGCPQLLGARIASFCLWSASCIHKQNTARGEEIVPLEPRTSMCISFGEQKTFPLFSRNCFATRATPLLVAHWSEIVWIHSSQPSFHWLAWGTDTSSMAEDKERDVILGLDRIVLAKIWEIGVKSSRVQSDWNSRCCTAPLITAPHRQAAYEHLSEGARETSSPLSRSRLPDPK